MRHRVAAGLLRVLDDAALAGKLGERARRRVERKFSLDAVGAQLREFIFRVKVAREAN